MVATQQNAQPKAVHESAFHRVERIDGYLRMVRSDEPYPSLAAIDAEYETLFSALAPYKGRDLGLLVDLREAKGRNDPGFEQTLGRWRRKSLEGHAPLVVLVKSALGKMHVERHMRDDGLEAVVTTDEAQALRLVGDRISGIVS